MTLRVGLNPYGLAYVVGLQGRGTARANPAGSGFEGFIAIATRLNAKVLEIFQPWLAELSDDELRTLRTRLGDLDMVPVVSGGLTTEGSTDGVYRSADLLGAKVIRFGLSPVLEGSRAAQGNAWPRMVEDIRTRLAANAKMAADHGVFLGIENHQDFTSAELVAFCEEAGPSAGITFDTGNAWPVAEAPIAFARTVAPYVKHIHLKDYRVQFTDQGYRLIRCAIGDGAAPLREIVEIVTAANPDVTAVLEPGALNARHIKLLTPEWWHGYAPKTAQQLAACLLSVRRNMLPEDADYRTPWEREEDAALVQFETDQINKSAANMRALGWM